MRSSPFYQVVPPLQNTWRIDTALQRHLERILPPEALAAMTPGFESLGELAAGEMMELARDAEGQPPTLTHFDPWGRRTDTIHLSPGWHAITRIAAEYGIVGSSYAAKHGWASRVQNFVLLHLFSPSSAYVGCPLAMSDGAVATLKKYGEGEFKDRAIGHLTTEDPQEYWTSGQWMTEKEGGSDVGRSSTVARLEEGVWRLYGTKWFTSATTSQCAITLARPEGAPEGSRGLSMFYVEPWNADGSANGVRILRLKDKLGTRALPTAELELDGAVAIPVGPLEGGIRKITTVLNIARYYNTNAAVCAMARCTQLARGFARAREAYGHALERLPLHVETLANLEAEYHGALAVGLRLAELLGKVENDVASEHEHAVWRILTPLAKLGTGKQVVRVASETLEAFGGAGYVEDTGIPVLLRDAQVLPIWEGTTNILSLDTLRAMAKEHSFAPFIKDLHGRLNGPAVAPLAADVRAASARLVEYATSMADADDKHIQTGARGFALSLYRTYAAALLCEHAGWELSKGHPARGLAAARRWIGSGLVDLVRADADRLSDNAILLGD